MQCVRWVGDLPRDLSWWELDAALRWARWAIVDVQKWIGSTSARVTFGTAGAAEQFQRSGFWCHGQWRKVDFWQPDAALRRDRMAVREPRLAFEAFLH